MPSGYYVYILHCVDDTYYTGVTNDLDRRFQEHQSGLDKNAYTAKRKPLRLVWFTTFNDPEGAIRFEKRLKKWSRAKKQALISGEFDSLPKLAMNARNRSGETKG